MKEPGKEPFKIKVLSAKAPVLTKVISEYGSSVSSVLTPARQSQMLYEGLSSLEAQFLYKRREVLKQHGLTFGPADIQLKLQLAQLSSNEALRDIISISKSPTLMKLLRSDTEEEGEDDESESGEESHEEA